ncbi:MAG: FtsW/RodA/SpoVE family cell cycle protein [Chitinophagaceae bacterium]
MLFPTTPSVQSLLSSTRGDRIIWGVVIVLAMISIMAVYSSTGTLALKLDKSHYSYLFKQIGVLGAGLFIMYILHRLDYRIFAPIGTFLFMVSLPLLVVTLVFGTTYNEGSRWLMIPGTGMTFQTSDLTKLTMFVYLSRQLSLIQDNLDNQKYIFKWVIGPVLVACGLIAFANLSTALLLGLSAFILFLIGRIRMKQLLLMMLVGLVLFSAVCTVSYFNKGRVFTWAKRVETFFSKDKKDEPFQVTQAKVAIAKGGLLGKGPGNSTQRNFLPHPYSDFIYAIIIEEYGILGGLVVMGLYLLFLWRSIRLFQRCPYAFGAFLAVGLSFTLVIQAFVNMAVNVNLIPVTGLTLPLISMGGSSIIFTSITFGIILSVSRFVEELEGNPNENPQNENA